MPRKKADEITEQTVEKVTGHVEGKTPNKQALALREQAMKDSLLQIDYSMLPKDSRGASGTLLSLFRRNRRISGFRTFDSGAELQGAIDAYFEMIYQAQAAEVEIVPDIELLASFLGVTRNVLFSWMRGEANPEFVQVLDLAFNDIATGKKQYALQHKVAPLVYLSDMQNNHGYVAEQRKQDVQLNFRVEQLTKEQLLENANLLP